RLELRVFLRHHQQSRQRAAHFSLRRLELLQRAGIRGAHLHLADPRTRLGDLLQDLLLLLRISLARVDYLPYESGAALVLVDDLGPRPLRPFIRVLDAVVAAAGHGRSGEQDHESPRAATQETGSCLTRGPAAGAAAARGRHRDRPQWWN